MHAANIEKNWLKYSKTKMWMFSLGHSVLYNDSRITCLLADQGRI